MDGRAQIEEMFGNPANSDGTLNEAWEGANIRKIAPPDGWHLFYQADTGLVPVSGIRMHRKNQVSKIAESFVPELCTILRIKVLQFRS